MVTWPRVSSITIVLRFAFATEVMSASWLLGSERSATSKDSAVHCVANKNTTWLVAAKALADSISFPGFKVTLAPGAFALMVFYGEEGLYMTGPYDGINARNHGSALRIHQGRASAGCTPTSACPPITEIDRMLFARASLVLAFFNS
ncbi:MAG: hypothetical protein ACI9Y1_002548, partial [Lentisphaeria bacterium]